MSVTDEQLGKAFREYLSADNQSYSSLDSGGYLTLDGSAGLSAESADAVWAFWTERGEAEGKRE